MGTEVSTQDIKDGIKNFLACCPTECLTNELIEAYKRSLSIMLCCSIDEVTYFYNQVVRGE